MVLHYCGRLPTVFHRTDPQAACRVGPLLYPPLASRRGTSQARTSATRSGVAPTRIPRLFHLRQTIADSAAMHAMRVAVPLPLPGCRESQDFVKSMSSLQGLLLDSDPAIRARENS